eukprot:6272509-Pyramimonas_sp.AAC.1
MMTTRLEHQEAAMKRTRAHQKPQQSRKTRIIACQHMTALLCDAMCKTESPWTLSFQGAANTTDRVFVCRTSGARAPTSTPSQSARHPREETIQLLRASEPQGVLSILQSHPAGLIFARM